VRLALQALRVEPLNPAFEVRAMLVRIEGEAT